MEFLFEKYRQYRKKQFLELPGKYKAGYAFLGVGNHSISNLYPIIQYLGIIPKWIFSRKAENAEAMATRFAGCKGTNDLNRILQDPAIEGVIICLHASAHAEVIRACIKAGKKVWVEKPPVTSAQELKMIGGLGVAAQLMIGVQKRTAPAIQVLRKRLRQQVSYQYNYETGPFPDGDPFLELWIHPVDLAVFLFGSVKKFHSHLIGTSSNGTLQLWLEHESGSVGQLNLSTSGSWNRAGEKLKVYAGDGLYELRNLHHLQHFPNEKRPLGIPLEKIRNSVPKTLCLFDASEFTPLSQHNQIHVHGYYDALRLFAEVVEGRATSHPADFSEVKSVLELLLELKQ